MTTKGALKKCTLYALSFVLSLTVLSTAFSDNTYAASQYDDLIMTSPLYVTDSSQPDGKLDVTNTYMNYVTEAYNRNQSYLQPFMDRLESNLASGSGWATTKCSVGQDIAGFCMALFDPDAVITFDTGCGNGYCWQASKGQVDILIVGAWWGTNFAPGSENSVYNYTYLETYGSATGYSNYGYYYNAANGYKSNFLLIASDNVIYPDGYEGEEIPSGGLLSDVVLSPEVDYIVDNRKVTLTYKKNIVLEGCSAVNWSYKKDGENEMREILLNKSVNESYTKEVSDHGKYIFVVDVTVPTPCAPLPEGTTLRPTLITLNMDGRSFSGSTSDLECTDQGDFSGCLEPSPFEDCSTYGVDLIGGMGCQLRNFAVGFKVALITLFVPTAGVISDIFNDLNNFFTHKFGFLLYPIEFLNGILTAFQAPEPQTALHIGPILGQYIDFDFKTIPEQFPAFFTFVQVALGGVTMLGLTFAIHRKYMGIIKS